MSHTCYVLDILSNAPMRSNCGLNRQNILYLQDMSSDRINTELFLRMKPVYTRSRFSSDFAPLP